MYICTYYIVHICTYVHALTRTFWHISRLCGARARGILYETVSFFSRHTSSPIWHRQETDDSGNLNKWAWTLHPTIEIHVDPQREILWSTADVLITRELPPTELGEHIMNSLPDALEVRCWTVESVANFFEEHNLARYVENIREYDIDGAALLQFEDEKDLTELGFGIRIHRKKIIALVQGFQGINQADAPPARGSVGPLHPPEIVDDRPVSEAGSPDENLASNTRIEEKVVQVKSSGALGIQLIPSKSGRVVVSSVSSEATDRFSDSVCVGDILLQLNGKRVHPDEGYRFEDTLDLLVKLVQSCSSERPLEMILERGRVTPLVSSGDEEAEGESWEDEITNQIPICGSGILSWTRQRLSLFGACRFLAQAD